MTPLENSVSGGCEKVYMGGNHEEWAKKVVEHNPQLENMIERAIVVCNEREIRLKDLPLEKDITYSPVQSLDDLEKKYIQQVLDKYDWNISRSAKVLKVDRVTLYNKIKKYGLKAPK